LAGDAADGTVAPAKVEDIEEVLNGAAVPTPPSISTPQTTGPRDPALRLLRRVDSCDPMSLAAYQSADGYAALRRAIEIGPAQVIAEVSGAKLQGRGGAAFPTGRKWDAVAKAPVKPHYLVCNADESEPGTFKDRVLMEEDPFAIVESMTIAGFAVGAELGYLYIRGEYPLATERLEHAIHECRSAGLLGPDVMGSGFCFDIDVRRGAGAYICGEETALFSSIEGFRGEPRNKPPFPVEVGLFGKPTVINNVETLANVLDILLEGGSVFAGVGTEKSTGSKLFCVSGAVEQPGLYEVPFGTTLRELLDLSGGISSGKRLKTVLLGGAAGSFVLPEHLDTPLTFEGTRAINASLGSGVVMAFDENADMRGIVLRIAAFFRDESCGQCVPCRVGTVRQEELLQRLARDDAQQSAESELLDELAQVMRDASICGLGHTAANAVQSAVALGLFGGTKHE
jgi:NADH-quinone oxidoreductase subunit F